MSLQYWQIERYLLGELQASEAEGVARELARDEAAAGRARELLESNRRILGEHPPRVAAAVIRQRLDAAAPAPSGRRRPLALALATSAVVLVAGSVLFQAPEPPVGPNRIKGLRPGLLVYRHTPSGDEALADRASARSGDLVQVAYQAAGRAFGAIVSLDGRGAITVHHPPEGRAAARLVSGSPVRLTNAYRLDDAPRWERFYFVTSDHSFDVDLVVAAARRLGGHGAAPKVPLALPAGLDQSEFTLMKEEPR
jgi:hypothetical protein